MRFIVALAFGAAVLAGSPAFADNDKPKNEHSPKAAPVGDIGAGWAALPAAALFAAYAVRRRSRR